MPHSLDPRALLPVVFLGLFATGCHKRSSSPETMPEAGAPVTAEAEYSSEGPSEPGQTELSEEALTATPAPQPLPEPGRQSRQDPIDAALQWLANQQHEDGSWHSPSADASPHRTTGLVLLAFLKTGHTHQEGSHQEVVSNGLQYLLREMQVENDRADFSDAGNLPSHAICVQALCEAYRMTRDEELVPPAQMAVNQILHTQNQESGGWGEAVDEPGNTLSFAWHLIALRNAHLAYLEIPLEPLSHAADFLDSVQADEGAAYGYDSSDPDPLSTAAGLQCRATLGWKDQKPQMKQGIETLIKEDPFNSDLLFVYFAAELLSHFGGEPWEQWYPSVREFLDATQSQQGADSGSWNLAGGSSDDEDQQLRSTALAILILVSHHNVPNYHPPTDEPFPL